MSVQVKLPATVYSCSMCNHEEWSNWVDLAKVGWRSNYAGAGLDPIILCKPCVDIINARRQAARELEAML